MEVWRWWASIVCAYGVVDARACGRGVVCTLGLGEVFGGEEDTEEDKDETTKEQAGQKEQEHDAMPQHQRVDGPASHHEIL